MAVIHYNKLVRDKIPQIIQASGKTCVTQVLSQEHYLRMLGLKLEEELGEYLESGSLEELADLLEVLRAVVEARGWSWDQLEDTRTQKARERGGFTQRILLREVSDPEVANLVEADPGVADPVVADPGVADPAVADPVVADPAELARGR